MPEASVTGLGWPRAASAIPTTQRIEGFEEWLATPVPAGDFDAEHGNSRSRGVDEPVEDNLGHADNCLELVRVDPVFAAK